MIKGRHAMFYSSEADALRAFIRDKLRLPCTDVGGGWLIFDLPEADLGVHPTEPSGQPRSGTHDISFCSDDVEQTVAALRQAKRRPRSPRLDRVQQALESSRGAVRGR